MTDLTFGRVISDARKEKGLSQKQLGDCEVRVKRAKDGSLEIADRVGLKRQVRELKLEQEKSKTRNPGHER